MKIAICASEAVPFAKTGGLADVCGALPSELHALGHEVVLVLPKYPSVKASGFPLKSVGEAYEVTSYQHHKVYFVCHDMFLRSGLYGDRFGDYPDNLKRFSYFCQKSLELLQSIDFIPDCIHCHDWQTSLIPVYLKDKNRDYFKGSKRPGCLLTVHNLAYQGVFPKEKLPETGLDWEYFTMQGLEYYGRINLLKGGILFADVVNTVSPAYAKEVLTKEQGCGLEGVLDMKGKNFSGVLNGLDYKTWNPQSDENLERRYTLKDLGGKLENKLKLQEACGFPADRDIFLLGFVGRLVEQKGIDILLDVIPQCVDLGMQIVMLGVGDPQYQAKTSELALKYPKNVFFCPRFDDRLAHMIYAGCDSFLMPSRFEPCGIGQLISFKYGAIPVVCKTGGLADTVIDVRTDPGNGSGFVFTEFLSKELFSSIRAAQEMFGDRAGWQALMKRVMKLNYSWKESAREYVNLYEKAGGIQGVAEE